MEQRILDLQIASLLVTDAQGHILLQHRDGNGAWPYKWSLPGGGIEPGETPEEGARRELEEETGLKIDGAFQLFWQGLLPAFAQPGAYRQWHVYIVRTQASQEDIVLGEGLAMVFTAPAAVFELDLTVPSRSILERFLVSVSLCRSEKQWSGAACHTRKETRVSRKDQVEMHQDMSKKDS